jgi:copper chaperone CopZ
LKSVYGAKVEKVKVDFKGKTKIKKIQKKRNESRSFRSKR